MFSYLMISGDKEKFLDKISSFDADFFIVNLDKGGYEEIQKFIPKKILKKQDIFEVFEKNKQQGITGFSDEKYDFIDEPIYKDAKMLLNKSI